MQARLDRLNARRANAPSPADGPSKPARRRHAAAGSRLVALGLSVASTSGLGAYFLAATPVDAATRISAATVLDPPAPAATTHPSETSAVQGGTYRNRWGDVQVQATFATDGSLAAVDTIQVPGGRSRSVRINNGAIPRLEAEALAAQGTHIDTVSGATYTSTDYRRSLQSAIDAARAAGITALA
jgi:uncharacterized protein with FMN-binding domain